MQKTNPKALKEYQKLMGRATALFEEMRFSGYSLDDIRDFAEQLKVEADSVEDIADEARKNAPYA